jgi:hypothetical protein
MGALSVYEQGEAVFEWQLVKLRLLGLKLQRLSHALQLHPP